MLTEPLGFGFSSHGTTRVPLERCPSFLCELSVTRRHPSLGYPYCPCTKVDDLGRDLDLEAGHTARFEGTGGGGGRWRVGEGERAFPGRPEIEQLLGTGAKRKCRPRFLLPASFSVFALSIFMGASLPGGLVSGTTSALRDERSRTLFGWVRVDLLFLLIGAQNERPVA